MMPLLPRRPYDPKNSTPPAIRPQDVIPVTVSSNTVRPYKESAALIEDRERKLAERGKELAAWTEERKRELDASTEERKASAFIIDLGPKIIRLRSNQSAKIPKEKIKIVI